MPCRLRILWSDGSTLVLNKPAGLAVQDIAPRLNRILRRPASAPVWLPHRIDKYTRGLQVVTVCKDACSALNRSSEQRRWRKRYRALTCIPSGPKAERSPLIRADGSLVPEGWLVSGIVRRPLYPAQYEALHPYVPNNMLFNACQLQLVESEREPCPDPEGDVDAESAEFGTNDRNRQDRGAWACTHFRLATVSNCQRYAAYDVRLTTGRTHQIRVHFASANFPLANDFYYNEAAFYIAETFRFRASAAQRENRWPAGSNLAVPPAPEPWLSASGKPGRVPWRGRKPAACAPTLSSGAKGSEDVTRTETSSDGKGAGGPRQIAQPLPQALELGLQAYSLHLPVPAPTDVDGQRRAMECGIHLELPWPAEWNVDSTESAHTSTTKSDASDRRTVSSVMPVDAGCTVLPWEIPSGAQVAKPNRRQRRDARRRQQAIRGLVITDLHKSERDPACLAKQFSSWGSVTKVSVRKGRANVVALLEFGGDYKDQARAVESIIAEEGSSADSKWRGRLHRWN